MNLAGDRPASRGIAARIPAWLAALVWLPVVALPLCSDDYELLWALRDGGLRGAWFTHPAPFFRPGMSAMYLLEDALAGGLAWPRHLLSITAHLGCTVLVGRLAERLKPGSGVGAALCFGVLACHGEAVVWVAAQGDLFAAFFGLIYLLAAIESRRWAGALLLIACAFKESALGLPIAAWALRGRPDWDLVIVPLWLALRAAMLGDWVAGYGVASHMPADPLRYVASVTTMALRTLAPPILPHPTTVSGWAALVVVGGGALAVYLRAWGFGRAEARLSLAWGAALLPVLAMGARMDRFEAERFLYLPSAFMCVLVAGRVQLWPLVVIQVLGVALSISAWTQSAAQVLRVRSWMEAHTAPPAVLLLPEGVRGTYSLRNGASGLWRSTLSGEAVALDAPMRVGSPRLGVPVEATWGEDGWRFSSEGGWFTGENPAKEGWYWDGEGMRWLGARTE